MNLLICFSIIKSIRFHFDNQAKGIAYGAFECFDIEKLATKDEIKRLATKEDLARSIHTLFMQLLGVIIGVQTVMIGLMFFLHR